MSATEPRIRIPCPDWIISDTHIGHPSMLGWYAWRRSGCGLPMPARDEHGRYRPTDAQMSAHDERIIAAWKATVRADDVVLHLGDVCWNRAAAERCATLPGRIYVVKGNHDETRYLRGWSTVALAAEFTLANGATCLARHNPAHHTMDDARDYTWLLHGHLHERPAHIGHAGEDPVDAALLPQLASCCMDWHERWEPMPITMPIDRAMHGYRSDVAWRPIH